MSVKAAPVTAVAFGFSKVIFNTVVSFVPTEPGVKTLLTVKGAGPLTTLSVPMAAAPLPAFVVATGPLLWL